MLEAKTHSKNGNSFNSKQKRFPFFGTQPKLNIGKPNDKYEVEADRVADQVVFGGQSRTNNFFTPRITSQIQNQPEEDVQMLGLQEEFVQEKPVKQPIKSLIQRQDVEEEEPVQMQEEEEIQTKSNSQSTISSETESKLQDSTGGGSPLDIGLKSQMEDGFGANFSDVRTHRDSKATRLNNELGAQAFTRGSDIYFNKNKYKPGTGKGQHLIAHELTHVIQQRSGSGSNIINRFGYDKHQSVGDIASGGNIITLFPGKDNVKAYTISYGEMVALAGDFFGTLDEMKSHASTESGQRKLDYARSKGGSIKEPKGLTTQEKKEVDALYYELNSKNYAHFSTSTSHNNNVQEYLKYHDRAVSKAFEAGQTNTSMNEAFLLESFGGHFLTDAFTGGHITSPRQAAKEHWINIYPLFIENFINHLTEFLATHINENTIIKGTLLTVAGLKERVLQTINNQLPPGIGSYSLGGLLSVAVHDWYNAKGLDVVSKVDESGNQVKGGHKWKAFGEIVTLNERDAQPQKLMVVAALKSGLKDLEEAKKATNYSDVQKLKPYKVLDYIPQPDSTTKSNIDFKWKFKDINELVADQDMIKAIKFMLSDSGSVGSMLISVIGEIEDEDAKKAFNVYISQLRTNTQTMLKQIADYVPGGKKHHFSTDDMSRKYTSDLAKTGSVKKLTSTQMIGMIKKMMDGPTGDDDEAAILTILKGATQKGEVITVIKGVGGFFKLADEFHGSEWYQLLKLLKSGYFKRIGLSDKYSLLYYIYDNNSSGEWREEAFIAVLEAANDKNRAEFEWIVKRFNSNDKDIIDDFLDGAEQKRFDAIK
ncbi:MAG: DUF4157 domain-containing protein [Mariniphaga sp.]|nr:DUF4157 domain-containing protein [Mariniphaga sp.]